MIKKDEKKSIVDFIEIVSTTIDSKLEEVDDLVLFRLDKRIEEVFAEIDNVDTDIDSFDVVGFAHRCRNLLESCDSRYHAMIALKEEIREQIDLLKQGIADTNDMRVFMNKYRGYTYVAAPTKKGKKGD
jgi:hypothetical protein